MDCPSSVSAPLTAVYKSHCCSVAEVACQPRQTLPLHHHKSNADEMFKKLNLSLVDVVDIDDSKLIRLASRDILAPVNMCKPFKQW
jgi:hypothetical protein